MARSKGKSGQKITLKNKTQKRFYQETLKARKKVSRVKSKYGIDLSGSIPLLSKKEIADSDFRELRKLIKELEHFRSPKNLETRYTKNAKGLVLTQAKRKRIDEANQRMQKMSDDWQKKYGDKTFQSRPGANDGMSMSQLESVLGKRNNPNPYKNRIIDLDKYEEEKSLDRIIENWEKAMDPETIDLKLIQYKANYIAMLHKRYNGISEQLEDKINSVPDDDFLELTAYLFNDLRFDVSSDPMTDGEVDDRLELLEQVLDDFLAGKPEASTELKQF